MVTATLNHPLASSDFCIESEVRIGGRVYALSGVVDTIGRPSRRRVKRVIKRLRSEMDATVAAVAEDEEMHRFDQRFMETITRINSFTHECGRKQKGFFGFCCSFALRIDREVRVHWIGDCRAYHFRRAECGKSLNVRCLSIDNNKLSTEMLEIEEERPGAEVEMLKNEMIELSRQLEFYLGIGNDRQFAEILGKQTADLELPRGDMLMLTTDGILMPVIRYEVANTGFKLTKERLYLEEWFKRYVENGEYLLDYEGIRIWDAMLADLKSACIKYTTRRRRRYRDDMAVVYMC